MLRVGYFSLMFSFAHTSAHEKEQYSVRNFHTMGKQKIPPRSNLFLIAAYAIRVALLEVSGNGKSPRFSLGNLLLNLLPNQPSISSSNRPQPIQSMIA